MTPGAKSPGRGRCIPHAPTRGGGAHARPEGWLTSSIIHHQGPGLSDTEVFQVKVKIVNEPRSGILCAADCARPACSPAPKRAAPPLSPAPPSSPRQPGELLPLHPCRSRSFRPPGMPSLRLCQDRSHCSSHRARPWASVQSPKAPSPQAPTLGLMLWAAIWKCLVVLSLILSFVGEVRGGGDQWARGQP